jgi:hypothetical protein
MLTQRIGVAPCVRPATAAGLGEFSGLGSPEIGSGAPIRIAKLCKQSQNAGSLLRAP